MTRGSPSAERSDTPASRWHLKEVPRWGGGVHDKNVNYSVSASPNLNPDPDPNPNLNRSRP